MATAIESAVQSIYYDNYFSMVITTVLVYDYLLAIGEERWGSMCTFRPSLLEFKAEDCPLPPGTGFNILGSLGFYVILWASAGKSRYGPPGTPIMVLRVFAMYNQSKIILGVLLLFFVPTIVATIVIIAKLLNISMAKSGVIIFDLLGTNYCADVSPLSRSQSLEMVYLFIPRICLDMLLVVLAVGRLVKDAVDNRVPGKWQPNVYLRMLAKDSIMYFLLNLGVTIIGFVVPFTTFLTWYQYVGASIISTIPYMLAPHLIISFRYHTKADAIHSGFASQLGTSLGEGEQEMCFARPAPTSSMDERGV
ncbi:hypothetical protein BV22DRAFT_1180525 [Leucogyrophana mollusca]|uniref:Uncharacterized protein n=1 Tax=Leucogyrophana mollusca TaxID=85980 RepID=A0ACB8B4D2_9AGAM|nr:hypothetical protein BV22DRAFT_1180525 [Leucogyrophana mollusca]